VEGYLKALDDNNIPINEDILRTDSEEDLNSKIEAIFDNNTIDGVFFDENDPLRL
jgi:LacI family transcriptional regulator